MYELLKDIESLLDESNTQILITTHNSYVANKLDLSNLIMLERDKYSLNSKTLAKGETDYRFFSKVCHYPTLRMILSKAVILVEGPADEMVVTYHYYKKNNGKHPFNDGIELIAVGGIAFKEYVLLLRNFSKKVAVITDNDGLSITELLQKRGLGNLPDNIKVFTEQNVTFRTLEPSFVNANADNVQSLSDFLRSRKNNNDTKDSLAEYMENNKTEWSYRLLQNIDSVAFCVPDYISSAIEWITNDKHEQ